MPFRYRWNWIAQCQSLAQFNLSTIKDVFQKVEDTNYKRNGPQHNANDTVCECTSYILLSHLCHSKKPPIVGAYGYSALYAQRTFQQDSTINFWNIFKQDLFAKPRNEKNPIHEMYLIRLNQLKQLQKGQSVHDIVIEKLNNEYIIYQSCSFKFSLLRWIDKEHNNGVIRQYNSDKNNAIIQRIERIYNLARNKYGKSKILNEKEMSNYIDKFEQYSNLGILQYKMKREEDLYETKTNEFELLYDRYWNYTLNNYDSNKDENDFIILKKRPCNEDLNIDMEELKDNGYFVNDKMLEISYYDAIASFGLADIFGCIVDCDIDEIHVEVYDLMERNKKRRNKKRRITRYKARTTVDEDGKIVCR